MRITVLIGIVCAALWIIIKLIFFYTQPVAYSVVPLVLLNMFLLLAAISIGLYIQKLRDTETGNALRDIKNGMTAGVPYALVVSVFIYFYYAQIDPEYNAHQIAEREYALEEAMNDPKQFEEIKASDPDFEVLSKDEILKKFQSGFRASYSPNSVFSLSLLGLIVLSALNSIFITIIFRRIVFRNWTPRNLKQ